MSVYSSLRSTSSVALKNSHTTGNGNKLEKLNQILQLLRLENELFESYIRRSAICVDPAPQKTSRDSSWIQQLRNQSVLSEATTRHLLLDVQTKCTIAKREVEFYEKVTKEEEIQFELQSNQYKFRHELLGMQLDDVIKGKEKFQKFFSMHTSSWGEITLSLEELQNFIDSNLKQRDTYQQKVRLDTMRLMKQLRQKKIAVRMRIKQGVRGTQLDCTLLKYHNSALEETLLNKMDKVSQLNRQCSAIQQELHRAKTELDRATDELTRTLRAFERAVATLRKKREEVFRRTQEFKKETCWQKQLEEHYHRYKLPSINMAIENNRESLQLTKELKKRKRQMRIEKMKLENHQRVWHRMQFAQILRPSRKYAPEGHSPNNTSSALLSTDEIMKSDETEQEIRGVPCKKIVDTSFV